MTSPRADTGAIAFAEKLLALLDYGSFTATYKFAVLLGLIDLCLECSDKSGAAPSALTTRQLAQKVTELYWPQANVFAMAGSTTVLRQCTGGQAEILTEIRRFRAGEVVAAAATPYEARRLAPDGYEALVGRVEWKLIEMPLPRLQVVGNREDPFIYRVGWESDVGIRDVRRGDFDNRILLVGDAGDHLVRLAGLLRPLIHRQWVAMVARINRDVVEDARLEEFMFGAERIPLERVRNPLRELQDNTCFYCGKKMRGPAEVDHFVPWARYPDNSIENLVVTDPGCNSAKRDFLAAAEHAAKWTRRMDHGLSGSCQLVEIAQATGWETRPGGTLSVARAIYLRLPPGAKLWLARNRYVDASRGELRTALGVTVDVGANADARVGLP